MCIRDSAKALADGTAKNGLCSPGGAACANDIAAILGVAAGEIKAKTAVCLLYTSRCV